MIRWFHRPKQLQPRVARGTHRGKRRRFPGAGSTQLGRLGTRFQWQKPMTGALLSVLSSQRPIDG
jgi:hypothetical protein